MDESIVFLGSCSVDFTVYTQHLPKAGETVHGTKFNTSFGGKGANQCVAAAKLGGQCYMIARVGDDLWGQKYIDHLNTLGINTRYVTKSDNKGTGIAQITVDDDGENQITIVSAANKLLSVNDVNNASDLIVNAKLLIAQLETPLNTTLEAFKLNKGIKILNAAPGIRDVDTLLQLSTILCVNESEASTICGQDVENISDAVKAVKKLLGYGCETVIITLGNEGAVYSQQKDNTVIHVLSQQVKPVDTTGAGDCFIGALATFLWKYPEKPFHQQIGAACHIASISVTKEGTQTSYPSDIPVFDRQYDYKII